MKCECTSELIETQNFCMLFFIGIPCRLLHIMNDAEFLHAPGFALVNVFLVLTEHKPKLRHAEFLHPFYL